MDLDIKFSGIRLSKLGPINESVKRTCHGKVVALYFMPCFCIYIVQCQIVTWLYLPFPTIFVSCSAAGQGSFGNFSSLSLENLSKQNFKSAVMCQHFQVCNHWTLQWWSRMGESNQFYIRPCKIERIGQ